MPEHQQIEQSKKPESTFQKQATHVSQSPVSNPFSIIQRAKINPKSLTHADVMQLQRTIGNRAVGRLLSSIGRLPSAARHATVQRQEIPEEEELLQGKMIDPLQRQEMPEEEEPLQGKMIGTVQRQEPEEEELIQGKMIETVQRQEVPEEEELLQGKFETVQRQEPEEELMQGKFTDECVQCQMPEDEEELMKGKFTSGLTGTLQAKEETPPNKTGMPDNLKSGIENISGMELSGVRVHYNSSKPGQLNALAYTQGVDIHVAPGQEQHLPHEAWHVVQQAQGRVKPTMQLKDGVPVNNDKGLEHEADVMGAKAVEKTVQFQGPEEEELLQGKFGVVKLKHEPSPQHAKGCACHGCTTQSGVKALSSTVQGKMYGAGIGLIQLKECWYCGYENGHAPGCTPEARAKAAKEKKDANRRAADQSNDNRTRKDQSHPHHGNKNVKKAWKK